MAQQPASQKVKAPKVVDLVRDVAGLGRSEPRAFFLADETFESRPRLERHQRERKDQRSKHALKIAPRRLLEDQAAKVHQWQREDVGEEQRPTKRRSPARYVRVKHNLRHEPAEASEHEQPSLQVVTGVVKELELFERGHKTRPHDRQEISADVVRVALGPTHSLA